MTPADVKTSTRRGAAGGSIRCSRRHGIEGPDHPRTVERGPRLHVLPAGASPATCSDSAHPAKCRDDVSPRAAVRLAVAATMRARTAGPSATSTGRRRPIHGDGIVLVELGDDRGRRERPPRGCVWRAPPRAYVSACRLRGPQEHRIDGCRMRCEPAAEELRLLDPEGRQRIVVGARKDRGRLPVTDEASAEHGAFVARVVLLRPHAKRQAAAPADDGRLARPHELVHRCRNGDDLPAPARVSRRAASRGPGVSGPRRGRGRRGREPSIKLGSGAVARRHDAQEAPRRFRVRPRECGQAMCRDGVAPVARSGGTPDGSRRQGRAQCAARRG